MSLDLFGAATGLFVIVYDGHAGPLQGVRDEPEPLPWHPDGDD